MSAYVWPLVGFLVVSKLMMLLLLSLRSQNQLKQHAAQLELIAQATHDCVWDWDLGTGKVWRSGKIQEIFGVSRDQIVPEMAWWRDRIDPHQQERVWSSLMTALMDGSERWNCEYRLRRADGSWLTISDRAVIQRNKRSKPTRVLGGMADISAERQAEEQLLHTATHDGLTGLPNRQFFVDRLGAHGANAARVAILVIDLDRFKAINDLYGRETGDQLLISVGTRIRRLLREGDVAARLGSDEFAVSLESVNAPSEAMQVGHRILNGLAVPFELQDQRISLSASVGITYNYETTAEGLLHYAGLAMHQAKRQGRAQVEMFDPAFEAMARQQMQLEGELRHSFHDGSLRMHYQPIVSLENGGLASFEALLRWQHAVRGLVFPSEIFPVIENAGLSVKLGKWVFQETCQQLRNWRETLGATGLDINVNLSGAEFIRPALVDEVKQVLAETGVPGESLVIEVTETVIMESNVDAARRLSQLRDMGIRLALDDFGKGHSSLGRLQDFPISILKIDSSFVKQIREGKRQILDAIIALAHELQLEITAEGVETREQLRYLHDRGAAKVQGLLFAPALPPESAAELLGKPSWDFQEYLRPSGELSSGMTAG